MCKGLLYAIILLLFSSATNAEDNVRLPAFDKTIHSDSITLWYKLNVRPLDSVQAFTIINRLEQKGRDDENKIIIATSVFLKGLYFEGELERPDEGKRYIEQAIAIAEKEKLDYEWAEFTFELGIFNFFHDDIGTAIECLLRANDKFRQIGYDKDRNAALHLYHIGYVYYHLHNYRESLKYLREAFTHPYEGTWAMYQLPNTMGLAYSKLGMYDSAVVLFNKILQKASATHDTLWMGIVSGNIGETYMKRKDYDKAIPYLEKNYLYVKHSPEKDITGNIINALVSMADAYIAKGNLPKATALLGEAQALWPNTTFVDYWRQDYLYETMAKASAAGGDFHNAYRYLERSREVNDSMARRDDALRYTSVQQQLASEKHLAIMRLVNEKQKIVTQRRRFVIAAFVLLACIGWLLFNRQRLKVKKDVEIRDKKEQLMLSEHLRMEEDLEHARLLLGQYLESITEKNNLIEGFKERLARSTFSEEEAGLPEEHVEYLQQLAEAILLTDEEWEKFKELFEKVYKGFFVRLKHKVPDLTEAEIRLLALIKLNISNKHMAQMLGISPSSVHTARYRLRKKISLPDEVQLEEIIATV